MEFCHWAFTVALLCLLVVQESQSQSAHELSTNCTGHKRIKLRQTLRSNLGKKGPDHEEPEGIVYAASDYGDAASTRLQLHVNVVDQDGNGSYIYEPAHPSDNGMYGQFGDINLVGGRNVTLRFTATNPTGHPITISKLYLSFFDLDIGISNSTGLNLKTTEAITVFPGWSTVQTSANTQLARIDNGDGSQTFKATMLGLSGDSPTDPEVLNAWQMSKTVTIHYDDFQTADITLHAYGPLSTTNRYFQFVLEPSILCAGEGGDLVHPTTTTWTTSTLTTTLEAPPLFVESQGSGKASAIVLTMLVVVAALIVCVSLGVYAFRRYSTPRKGEDHLGLRCVISSLRRDTTCLREVGDISSKPKELDEARISELSTPTGADEEVGDISSKPKELDEARISELSTPTGADESIDSVGHAPPAIDGDACSAV